MPNGLKLGIVVAIVIGFVVGFAPGHRLLKAIGLTTACSTDNC